MAKRSLETEEEEDPASEIEEETESEEEERMVERGERRKRGVIRVVVPVQQRSSESLFSSSGLVSCSGSSVGGNLSCQGDECGMDLSNAKVYHRRHKVCERHAKAAIVLVKGIRQRFCQQCSRFHGVSEFDDCKRSCRRRLAGHNERRRKSQADLQLDRKPTVPKSSGNSTGQESQKA